MKAALARGSARPCGHWAWHRRGRGGWRRRDGPQRRALARARPDLRWRGASRSAGLRLRLRGRRSGRARARRRRSKPGAATRRRPTPRRATASRTAAAGHAATRGQRVEPRDQIAERQQGLALDQLEQRHLDHQLGHAAVLEVVEHPREAIEPLREHAGLDLLGLRDQLLVEVVAHVEQRVAAAGQLDHGQVAQVLEDRQRELLEVRAALRDGFELLQESRGVALDDRLDQGRDGEAAGLAEHLEHLGAGDRQGIGREGDDLVEQRERVADRALAAAGDHVEALFVDDEALVAEDLLQVGDQGARADPAIVEPRDPREDRRQDLVRVRGREHEGDVGRRLLERLQQGVEGLLGQHVDLVDDVDLAPGELRQVVDLLAQRSDVVDRIVRGAVDLDHVDRATLVDGHALLAHVAGLGRGPMLADQRLGQDPRGGGLAQPTHAAKEIGMVDAVGRDRVGQRARHVLLADHVGEALRTVFAGEGEVGHRDVEGNPCPRSRHGHASAGRAPGRSLSGASSARRVVRRARAGAASSRARGR